MPPKFASGWLSLKKHTHDASHLQTLAQSMAGSEAFPRPRSKVSEAASIGSERVPRELLSGLGFLDSPSYTCRWQRDFVLRQRGHYYRLWPMMDLRLPGRFQGCWGYSLGIGDALLGVVLRPDQRDTAHHLLGVCVCLCVCVPSRWRHTFGFA